MESSKNQNQQIITVLRILKPYLEQKTFLILPQLCGERASASCLVKT
jgi:hypothetical protein